MNNMNSVILLNLPIILFDFIECLFSDETLEDILTHRSYICHYMLTINTYDLLAILSNTLVNGLDMNISRLSSTCP